MLFLCLVKIDVSINKEEKRGISSAKPGVKKRVLQKIESKKKIEEAVNE